MPGTLTITKPTNSQQMASTFWACGKSSGLDTIKVQIFAFNTSSDDMQQIAEVTATITSGMPLDSWSAQFSSIALNPSGPMYVLMVSGCQAANPSSTAITVAPVQFSCTMAGNSSGC